jgi:hypothetical protein
MSIELSLDLAAFPAGYSGRKPLPPLPELFDILGMPARAVAGGKRIELSSDRAYNQFIELAGLQRGNPFRNLKEAAHFYVTTLVRGAFAHEAVFAETADRRKLITATEKSAVADIMSAFREKFKAYSGGYDPEVIGPGIPQRFEQTLRDASALMTGRVIAPVLTAAANAAKAVFHARP